MPELPEVETIRRDLASCVLHKKIKKVDVKKSRLVRNSASFFVKSLKNNEFTGIDRVGKLIIFVLKNKEYLLVHLKMTGQLIYQDKKSQIAGGHSYNSDEMVYPNKYTYIIFTFSDGSNLYFNDMRTFGYLQVVDEKELDRIKSAYGIEPIDPEVKLSDWRKVFINRRTNLKALLLNQKVIAGIGNIYADEICFASRIRPDRPVFKLTKSEVDLLFKNSKRILQQAIKKRGTTFNNYVDGQGQKGNFVKYLRVYGRTGKICLNCRKVKIKRIKLAGRSTHFCPNCQK